MAGHGGSLAARWLGPPSVPSFPRPKAAALPQASASTAVWRLHGPTTCQPRGEPLQVRSPLPCCVHRGGTLRQARPSSPVAHNAAPGTIARCHANTRWTCVNASHTPHHRGAEHRADAGVHWRHPDVPLQPSSHRRRPPGAQRAERFGQSVHTAALGNSRNPRGPPSRQAVVSRRDLPGRDLWRLLGRVPRRRPSRHPGRCEGRPGAGATRPQPATPARHRSSLRHREIGPLRAH
mmetsp:Transcript_9647/g.27164  ORF Transcript_9647/g.27164 Transcript_9647/m.27164 type:complete len:235 (-) Transcript_9647:634-1338(-)